MTNDTNPSCVTQEWALRQLVTTMVLLHYSFRAHVRKKWNLTIGHHLSWYGKVAAEQPERLFNRTSGQTAPSIQVGLFKPSRAWEGGAGGDGWVVLSLQVEIDSKEKSGAAGKVVQSYMSKLLKECLIS